MTYPGYLAKQKWIRSAPLAICGSAFFTSLWIKKIQGVHHIPYSGSFILAGNHSSLVDGPLLAGNVARHMSRPVHMISIADPFSHWFTGYMLKSGLCIPVQRGDRESQELMMKLSLGYLKRGEVVGIFPEGKTNPTRKLRKPRPGLALMALESGAPIVPAGIRNSRVVFPIGARPKLSRSVEVHIGAPISVAEESKEYHAEEDKAKRHVLLRRLLDKVMLKIAELSDMKPAALLEP